MPSLSVEPPAWFKVLVPGWVACGNWGAVAAREVREGLVGRRVQPGNHADALFARMEKDEGVREWMESPQRWIPPDHVPVRNPLALTPGEIARFFPCLELQRDPDVFACQAFYQGVCNRTVTILGYSASRRQIQAGVDKISAHPATLILVAAPYMRVRNLIQIHRDSMEHNLEAVERSLMDGSRMQQQAINAWLSSSVFEVSLQIAVSRRKLGDRQLPIGWWKAGGEPFSPAHAVQPLDEETLAP